MDNIRSAIDILFRRIDPGMLLKQHSVWRSPVCSVDMDFFTDSYLVSHSSHTENQTDLLYRLLREEWMKDGTENISIFRVLLTFDKEVLRVINGFPVCRYEQYLRWHEMTAAIGEDILTCSFLADDDTQTQTIRKSFAWKTVLESDNVHLQALFKKGLSELHCHLNGSSINFDLNWLAIMNEPEYQRREWFTRTSGSQTLLYEYSLLAAFIRMYLFAKINNYVNTDFDALFLKIIVDENHLQLLPIYIDKLQSEIAYHSGIHAKRFDGRVVDYAIPKALSVHDNRLSDAQVLVGERRLLYECFRRIFDNNQTIPGLEFFLYLYLVIKVHVKDLIVQNNEVKGFANFKKFDKNKDVFVSHSRNKVWKRLVPELALESYKKDKNITYFEYRVAPKSTVLEMRKRLRDLNRQMPQNNKAKCVVHFIKHPDRECCFDKHIENRYFCRNSEARTCFRNQSRVIEALAGQFEDQIVGIDAANSEFGCRPEVFGEIYRRLQHLKRDTSMEMLFNVKWLDLGITYHVGEDYYDVVDGLRAIEEAILFLNLTDGARLGHAVALGIGVKEYYGERKNCIIIPKQDLLDNCAWLLAKMDEYAIPDIAGCRSKLMFEFQRLMSEIYPSQLMDYRIYYQSWLLRGDEPLLYRNVSEIAPDSEDFLLAPYHLNHFDKRIDVARSQRFARELYRDYHYDDQAKHVGHKPEEWKLPDGMTDIIDKIQAAMRFDVARRKIAIEVNPTSNLRICNIDTYDTHPILKFRNYGLSIIDKYNDCPQISVSINTDDKGIFATSLEKEYTLMSLALEKQKSEDGKPKFQPNNILNWLEGIRQEAEVQRFGEDEGECEDDEEAQLNFQISETGELMSLQSLKS